MKGLVSVGLGLYLAAPVLAADATLTDAAAGPVLIRRPDGLYLSGSVPLDVSANMEDVLLKGVPLSFLWQVDVTQHRWYWMDRVVASATRSVRLAYQPLTRHWRLTYGTGGPSSTGLQFGLSQSYESLADALRAASKVHEWKIADAARWTPDSGQRADLRFSLDLTQLPRPLQLSLFNQVGWNVTYQKSLSVPERLTPDVDPDTAASDAVAPSASH